MSIGTVRQKSLLLFRSQRRVRSSGGQVLVIGLIVCVGLFMVAISVANIGIMVAEKIKLQDTVDASAYSAAVAEARYMNLSAYINRAIVSNYNAMAFDTALWASFDAYDHGLASIAATIYEIATVLTFIPIIDILAPEIDLIGDGVAAVHSAMHPINDILDEMFAQDNTDLNSFIEIYNTDILSTYQGLLYSAVQAARYQVAKEVAAKMDRNVLTTSVLGLGAEAATADDLREAVDWVIKEPDDRSAPFDSINNAFNRVMSKDSDDDDHPLYLAAVNETSLDKFAAGRWRDGKQNTLRNFNTSNVLGDIAAPINTFFETACEIATFGLGSCNYNTDIFLGSQMRWGHEDKADQDRVPVMARKRMREVNFFGMNIDISWAPSIVTGMQGHTSGEKKADIANVANLIELAGFDAGRAGQCLLTGCQLNDLNVQLAATWFFEIPPFVVDDHWDGTYDVQPVDAPSIYLPGPGQAKIPVYIASVASEGTEDGTPKYDWKVDLDNVGFPLWHYPNDGALQRPNGSSGGGDSKNLLVGPSIGVVGVKKSEKLRGLHGLGIGNEYDIVAMSRAQVYYLRNPNRSDELPSTFNPHWVARLAPIESEDTPGLIREALPLLASTGVPIVPTH